MAVATFRSSDAASAARGFPQTWQKRASTETSDPQFGQRGVSDSPQLEQNRALDAFAEPQLGQAASTATV
jgi:hypothetical protein